MRITLYHNPKCSTSRNVLGLLREAGEEPEIIEYLKTPPSRAELKKLVKRMGAKVSDIVRWKEPIAAELGLDKDKSSDDALLDAISLMRGFCQTIPTRPSPASRAID